MDTNEYIDKLIDIVDNLSYIDYCRILKIIYWNL